MVVKLKIRRRKLLEISHEYNEQHSKYMIGLYHILLLVWSSNVISITRNFL
jgi:hypothetical protein